MATPYSRPTTPKLTVPKIPAPKGGGIWGPATRQQALKTPKAAPTVSPYDQFTLPDPYAPKNISSLATSGYNTDTANAQKLAAMGYPTDASVTADYAARGATANGIQQALAAHLAGLQGVDVAQGNAGSAALGAQNAATQATAPHIAGAPAAPALPTSAVQAVLGSQTAAAGNYDSVLQAAALSTGATAEQNANNAGLVAQQGNQQSIQKTLAQLLSGVPSVSAREGTMTSANSATDAANTQTGLTIYTGLENRRLTAQAEGDKKTEAIAANEEKTLLANSSNTLKAQLAKASNQTKITTAKIGATAAGDRTAAQIKAANARAAAANKTRLTAAEIAHGTKIPGAKGYQVTYLLPATTAVDPNTGKLKTVPAKRVSKNINSGVWDAFISSGPHGSRKLKILGVPEGTKVQSAVARK